MSNGLSEEHNDSRTITMEEFIKLATEQDAEFEEILIDELPLQYRKDLNLPAGISSRK